MIYLYTDFTYDGPFVGQLKSAIYKINKNINIIDLMHDAPMYHVKYSAFILENLAARFEEESVFCCVVDPGVGSSRKAITVKINNQYFVGPDNGLFEYLFRSNATFEVFKISDNVDSISKTFHGRDLFAPTVAQISSKNFSNLQKISNNDVVREKWPDNLYEVIYIDPFGNLMTGIHTGLVNTDTVLKFKGELVRFADTYSSMDDDKLCWYINSTDLVELAVSARNAKQLKAAKIGDNIEVVL